MLLTVCQSRSPDPTASRVRAVYDKETGRLTELLYDSDGDGRHDVRTYMNGNRPSRSEIDTDEDGAVDRWESYDASGQLARVGTSSAADGRADTWAILDGRGGVARVERSGRRDGVVTRWEHLANGRLERAEEDANGDGRIDRWEQYEAGVLTLVALDTSFTRGRPDRRLVYGHDGEFLRIEVDPDGDGSFAPLVSEQAR